MIDEKLLLAHNVFSNKGAYALLLASGISRSAGIHTGWEILIQLINRLAVLEKEEIPQNSEEWYKQKYSTSPTYSQIIEQLTSTREERVNLLKPFFEASEDEISEGIKQPTAAHKAIAKLVQKGYIRVIVTTNFDRLMENALREIGIEATVISNPNHIENVMPLIHSPITIIKINGDYLDTKFLNIESELSAYDSRLVEYIQHVFENFGLITSGWSATWDIALREILQSSNKFRFANYFTYVNRCEELQKIASYRHGKLLQVPDADSFFKDLLENIEALESGQKISPLSKPIAVARLKKYIAKAEHRIALYEMIYDISENTFQSLNVQNTSKPDANSVKASIDNTISKLELICTLQTQGIYWGNQSHHDIWLKIMSHYAHPVKQKSSWAVWSSLAYFPALFIFYAAGLTALYKKDFGLLRKLFSLQVYNPYNEGEKVNILQTINPDEMVNKDLLNQVYGKNQIVPHSELLYQHIKSFFDHWMVNEKEFDELFDTYELLNSLFHIKVMGKVWFPLGRYTYRRRDQHNIIYTKIEDLKNQQEQLDWVKSGLFNDFNELLQCYTHFQESMKKISYH